MAISSLSLQELLRENKEKVKAKFAVNDKIKELRGIVRKTEHSQTESQTSKGLVLGKRQREAKLDEPDQKRQKTVRNRGNDRV